MNKGTVAVVSSAALAVVAWITASSEEKRATDTQKNSQKERTYDDYFDSEYDEIDDDETEGGIR